MTKTTQAAFNDCSKAVNDNIQNIDKTIYQGTNYSLRLTSTRLFDEYKEELAKVLDVENSKNGRNLFRFFTAKNTTIKAEDKRIRIHKGFFYYMKIDFADGERYKNVLISHHPTLEEDKEGYYSIVNPQTTKRLILLSASLMSNMGRKLVKEAIGYLDLDTKDKKMVIIFGRNKESDREYEKAFVRGCEYLGFSSDNIILSDDIENDDALIDAIANTDYIYVSDGNIYSTLDYIQKRNLRGAI